MNDCVPFFVDDIIVCLTFFISHAVNNLQTLSLVFVSKKNKVISKKLYLLILSISSRFFCYCKKKMKINDQSEDQKRVFSHALLISRDKKIVRLVVFKKNLSFLKLFF